MRRIEMLAAESPTLHAYLREIAKFPRLSAEEERALGARIQRGDADAARLLVQANLRFVVSYARRYRNIGPSFLDLIHEGNLGLIEAARRFDPARHPKFITYGAWWVRQAIMHELSGGGAPSPAPAASRHAQVSRQVEALAAQLEHAPAIHDRADYVELADADLQAMHAPRQDDDPTPDDRLWTRRGADEGAVLSDVLSDEAVHEIEDDLTRDALVNELECAMTELDPKERQVMRLRYGLHGGEPWSLQQVAERLHLSSERVRHIEDRATQKIRRRKTLRSYLN